ncbi:phosphatase PAP2 family protein [Paenibacillus sacheonensis]|uniref:Phosphatase PAP2 family protein n=1 Tax=Paenibacillus sacheonensis TaxID=742054 RepID=A0A7X4YU57_9BACL|nr:phosphatase PAP2 family protein [Paenibacillus sacheonensis]MBM7566994.1 undecaprenyl-diphosphatase [Paenibacillus sacheonensis]NBC71616.1 phosphatase PAP2 family protein [Paenibacillus sacheonensis]
MQTTTSLERAEQRAAVRRSDSTGFRTPDLFAKRPVIGVAIFMIGLAVFGILAYNVYVQGPMIQWDKQMADHMHTSALNSAGWVSAIMIAGYYIGLQGYIVLAVAMALYFLSKRYWKEFLIIAVGCIGQGGLWLLMANVFGRDRPVLDHPISKAIDYPSFPSGHTMSAVLCFGMLAYLLVPKIASRPWKAAVVVLALLLMAYIGFSRFFMGAHYLTDIVGGLALGFAWTAMVITVFEGLFRKKEENEHEQA